MGKLIQGKFGKSNLLVDRALGKITSPHGEDRDEDTTDRLTRIRNSIKRINDLMRELREKAIDGQTKDSVTSD